MGQTLSDKIATVTLNPMVINATTVNEYDDPALLDITELSVAQNVIFDKKMIQKVPGTLKYNSDSGAQAVLALHRAYGRDGTKKFIRLANGILRSDGSAFGTTSLLSALTTTKLTPFIDINNRAYGVNQTDGVIRYDPVKDQAIKTAITGPLLRKKIAFFESDETWTKISPSGLVTQDTDHFQSDEFSGKSCTSLKLTDLYNNVWASRTFNLDLSVFDNGKPSSEDDLICFSTLVKTRPVFLAIIFYIGAGYSTSFAISLYITDFSNTEYEWKHWKLKKSAFIRNNNPNWNNVTGMVFGYTDGTFTNPIYIDKMFLQNKPIKAVEMRRQIASCNSGDGFTGTGVSIANDKWFEDNSSLKFSPNANETLTATANPLGAQVDLSTWPNGVASPTSDEIVFQIYVTDDADAKISATDPLILRLGQSSTVYWTYTWVTKTTLGIAGRKGQWIEVRVKKSSFSAIGGIADWTGIDYCVIIFDFQAATTAWIDDIHMDPYSAIRQIATFEASDGTWTITGQGSNNASDKEGQDGAGSTQCLKLMGVKSGQTLPKENQTSYAVRDWTGSGGMDLSTFDGSVASNTDDLITFWLYVYGPTKIKELSIYFDSTNPIAASFANAYKYTLVPSDIKTDFKWGKYINIAKGDFETIGTPAGWQYIGACKFELNSGGNDNKGSLVAAGMVLIDNLQLKRKQGNTGRYYYKYDFRVKDVKSACSEISEKVDVRGSFVSISNLSTSQDSRVTARDIFRLGGNYPSTWMLVKSIEDNTTTEVMDDVDDADLIYPMGDDVPQGNINIVPCANINYDPQTDRAIYWGDPSHKNRIYCSRPGYYHVVDENGYREMSDDVMFVQPWYGQNIVFFSHTKKKIVGDVANGDIVDIPSTLGACSYYAVKKVSQTLLGCAGWDNVYIFDGYKDIPIGDKVKNYFIGRETYLQYMVMGWHKDTIYIACRDDTGAPDYNSTVLRYFIPTKSWSILPNWRVNVWSNWDKQNDQNEFYYGDSIYRNIYKMNHTIYNFDGVNIISTFSTGWINNPESELSLHHIELKARGTTASYISVRGYKDYSAQYISNGSIVFPATRQWRTYTLGPKNIWNLLRGDAIKIEFVHSTAASDFDMKDIVLYFEKIPKRVTMNEIAVDHIIV